MEQYPGSPVLRFDTGGQKWFDWWLTVTAALTVLFLVSTIASFVEAVYSQKAYEECNAEANYWTYNCDESVSDVFTIFGFYLLTVASCFGAATVAPLGSGGRRFFTIIGGLLFPPALIAFAAITLMTLLLGRVISLIRRIVRQSPPAVSGEMPRGSR